VLSIKLIEMAIGIIGGTGVYDPDILGDAKKVNMLTPYGEPSDLFTVGVFRGKKIVIVPRHGSGHTINPSNVNYRANVWALKEMGVTRILAPTAVGSLKEEIKPGDFVFADQFIDRTFGRANTFYTGKQVCHMSMAEPCCAELRDLLINEAKKLGFSFHEKGTCVAIEGPRFSTKAESFLFRNWGADIINMTMVPECILARELEICYATIAMVTDYDCWKDVPVNADEIIQTMQKNNEKVKKLLINIISKIPEERSCVCKTALKGAFI